jgi:hypothetical protein
MKKVISYSLWGNNPIYTIGAIKNSLLKNELFNDWEMWVYHDDTVPDDCLTELEKNDVLLIKKEDDGYIKSTWRFLPISDDTIDYFISRDADSRLSERDKCSVDDWIMSDTNFHIIRDHPVGHFWKMNAGMWGGKGGSIKNVSDLIYNFSRVSNIFAKEFDQNFLSDVIYPLTLNSLTSHDEFYNHENFAKPINRNRSIDDFAFIGESMDENDISRYLSEPNEQRKSIINIFKK